MANVIEIILKASDQTAGVFNGQTRAIDKLNESFFALTGKTLSYAGGVALAGVAVKKIVDFTREAIDETNAYNMAVADQARVIGEDVESMSRLVQVANDVFISQEQLKTAFAAASRQGIDVSIEGIQRLADEYLALPAGVERAEFVLKTFGRTGEEMGKLLELSGGGIRSAMDAVEDSIVVTDEAVKSTLAYKQMVDDLKDSWEGFTYTLGNKVIPVITKTVDTIDFLLTSQGTISDRMDDFAESSRNAGVSYEDYVRKIIDVAYESGQITKMSYNDQIRHLEKTGEAYRSQIGIMEVMSRRMYEAGDASGFWTESLVGMRNEIEPLAEKIDGVSYSIDNFVKGITDVNEIDPSFGSDIKRELDKLLFLKSGGSIWQGITTQIKEAWVAGTITNEEAQAMFEEAYLGAAAVELRMGESKDIVIAGIMATFEATHDEASKMINDFIAEESAKKIRLMVELVTGSSNIANDELQSGQDLNGNGIIGKAVGGYVAGGNSYIVGERGPELFTPSGGGQITPNGQLGGGSASISRADMLDLGKIIASEIQKAIG